MLNGLRRIAGSSKPLEKNGSSGRTRIPAQTYIQQDAEQRTAVLAILGHGKQCYWQVDWQVCVSSALEVLPRQSDEQDHPNDSQGEGSTFNLFHDIKS